MSYIDDAKNELAKRVNELEHPSHHDVYVRRMVFRAGTDPSDSLRWFALLNKRGEDHCSLLYDNEIANQQRLLLIGNAGSGKTSIAKFAFLEAAKQFLNDPKSPVPFYIDLDDDLASDCDIRRGLDIRYHKLFSCCLSEHDAGCVLILDSLDELLLRTEPRFVTHLEFFIAEHVTRLPQVVVCCRRSSWRRDWFGQSEPAFSVFHADYLEREAYQQIIPEEDRLDQFYRACHELGIHPLVATPFDGFYLARLFASGQALPSTRRKCIEQRIQDLLQGSQRDRREGQAPPLDRLNFLAHQIACVAVFAGRTSWTVQEAVDLLGSSEVLQRGATIRSGEVFAPSSDVYE